VPWGVSATSHPTSGTSGHSAACDSAVRDSTWGQLGMDLPTAGGSGTDACKMVSQ
jgi:hypothetical protein